MVIMRTPLKRVRGLGSARSGTQDFWRQRMTSVAAVPLMLFFLGFLVCYGGAPYEEVRAALANPVVMILIAFAFLTVLIHMRIGMQVVLEDYIHGALSKVILVMLNTFFPIVVGATALYGLVMIAFGG